ncbi:dTDP-4-dehydrorhamnose 3,5-epimerase [Candidatus Magnetomorum sp. HK-1]|nr:dTDP-4-dehydrorhamnose 3,5-epimerase [Candidatus Magnetomorum sp. HK-1]
MKVIKTSIPEVLVIETNIFGDERGYFMETHHQDRYSQEGIDCKFVQDNLSFSRKNILRGLHFQQKFPQAKLISVIQGEILDIAVDVRPSSRTFGQWVGEILSEKNHKQIFIPEGFAHGFCVLSDLAYVYYKCSDIYHPEDETGLYWADPDIGIEWPVENPIVSSKDQKNPLFKSFFS